MFNSWDEGLVPEEVFSAQLYSVSSDLVEEWNQCESGQASFTVYQPPLFNSLKGDEGDV